MPGGVRSPLWQGLALFSLLTTSAVAIDRFVSPTGGGVPPFTDWTSAATNIQDAIDASADGDVVWVTNGIYASGGKVMAGDLTNRVALDKALTVQSVNGPFATVIQGAWDPAKAGPGAVRCAWLTNGALLSGFTLRSGGTRSAGDFVTLCSGGGVWCASTNAVVANCVIRSNVAKYYASGAFRVMLRNCAVSGNQYSSYDVIYQCVLNSCTVVSNYSAEALDGCAATKRCAGLLEVHPKHHRQYLLSRARTVAVRSGATQVTPLALWAGAGLAETPTLVGFPRPPAQMTFLMLQRESPTRFKWIVETMGLVTSA